MLNQVEVRSSLGGLLALPFEDVSSGYRIEEISGLDPVPANIVTTSFVNSDGEVYRSSRRNKRNIVIKLSLDPDYIVTNVRGLRQNLYQFFMPKREVTLRFLDDTPGVDPLEIQGRVESFDAPLFSREPRADISILCLDPDFYNPTPDTVDFTTVSTSAEKAIDYGGTVSTGLEFTLNVNRTLSGFTLFSTAVGEATRSLEFQEELISGDVLRINTNPGSKGIWLIRDGIETSLLRGRSPQSDWTRLNPGLNQIRVYAAGAAIPCSITYTEKHGGL